MTQKQLIKKYIEQNGFIIPAKMGGKAWNGGFFGSETSKRCRELRQAGILRSESIGKFEKFYFTIPHIPVVPVQKEEKRQPSLGLINMPLMRA